MPLTNAATPHLRRSVRHVQNRLNRTVTPWTLLFVAVTALVTIKATGPLDEADSFWHTLIGYDILAHHRFTGNPSWTFGPSLPWVSTQWLPETVFAGLHHMFGWKGLTGFTLVMGLLNLHVLARLVRRTINPDEPIALAHHPAVAVVYTLTATAVAVSLQQRPAIVSWVFLSILSHWTWQALTRNHWPHVLTVALTTWLWAQIHGYWVLTVATIVFVAVLRATQARSLHGTRTPTVLAVAATIAGALTPAGPSGLLAPLTVKASASPWITEWAPTTLTGDHAALAVLGLLTLWVLSRIYGTEPVPYSEAAWVLAWAVFAMLAYRNLVPAAIMLTPAITSAVYAAWPSRTNIRGTILTQAVAAALLAATVTTGAYRMATTHALDPDRPNRIYTGLADQPGQRRVLTDYNLSGQVLALTRPGVQVALDGRADRYGPRTLTAYMRLLNANPGWETTLRTYNPTDVVIPTKSPLSDALRRTGWQLKTTQNRHSWWQPPTPTPSSPTPP